MDKPILVIGDSCMDVFVYCHCERLCPEAPVPVLDILYQVENLGMAGNVYRNVKSIQDKCVLITNDNFSKVTKTRYVEKKTNHMFLRIDSNEKINRISLNNLWDIKFEDYSAVVISDYDKGFLETGDINWIAERHPLTFLDTKKVLGDWARNIKFIKINRKEERLSHQQIIDFNLTDKVITTLGSGGCMFQGKCYPVNEVEIKDLSGAGDSFLAALVVKYLETNGNVSESLKAANDAATIVVQKMGVSVIKE